MVEFLQTYGLWIALAGVFVAMHWFGRGCCGGKHRVVPTRDPHGVLGEEVKGEQESETRKSKASCH